MRVACICALSMAEPFSADGRGLITCTPEKPEKDDAQPPAKKRFRSMPLPPPAKVVPPQRHVSPKCTVPVLPMPSPSPQVCCTVMHTVVHRNSLHHPLHEFIYVYTHRFKFTSFQVEEGLRVLREKFELLVGELQERLQQWASSSVAAAAVDHQPSPQAAPSPLQAPKPPPKLAPKPPPKPSKPPPQPCPLGGYDPCGVETEPLEEGPATTVMESDDKSMKICKLSKKQR